MAYKNDRKDWWYNFPIIRSDDSNDYAFHRAGSIGVHRGKEGFKFYVIRAIKIKEVTNYGRTYTHRTAFVQLISCPDRKTEDSSTRLRITERGFCELNILDVDRYMENEARVFTEMVELATLRLTQTDAIDKLAKKHGDILA